MAEAIHKCDTCGQINETFTMVPMFKDYTYPCFRKDENEKPCEGEMKFESGDFTDSKTTRIK